MNDSTILTVEEIKKIGYLDGDKELHLCVLHASNDTSMSPEDKESQVNMYKQMLQRDKNYRQRIAANKTLANDTELEIINSMSKETIEEGFFPGMSVPLGEMTEKILSSILARSQSWTNNDPEQFVSIQDSIKEMLSPILHRALWSEAVLLDLQRLCELNYARLPSKFSAQVSEIVGDAELVTQGKSQVNMAIRAGYRPGDGWNFSKLPSKGPEDLTIDHYEVISNGRLHYVSVANFTNILRVGQSENEPQGRTLVEMDNGILEVVDQQRSIIPLSMIACWRAAKPEDIEKDLYAPSHEYHEYNMGIYSQYLDAFTKQEEERKRYEEDAKKSSNSESEIIKPETSDGIDIPGFQVVARS